MPFLTNLLVALAFLGAAFNPLSIVSRPVTTGMLPQSQQPQTQSLSGTTTIYLPVITTSVAAPTVTGYFVATTGSDSNPGTLNSPWRTIQHAVGAAPNNKTIYIRAGEFTGFVVERTNLTISGYPGETPSILNDGNSKYTVKVMNSSGITLSGLAFRDNMQQYGVGIYIEDSNGVLVKNSAFYDNQGFGVVTKNVTNVTLDGNDLYRNANAIEIRYTGNGVLISNNKIHHNFREIDPGRGAMGINFYKTAGSISAIGNQLWENHSIGLDNPEGSAFEVYAGGSIAIISNVIWDNETVLETGTTEGAACPNITFMRNIVFRGNRQQGLILRCASNSLFAHNIFDGLDEYVFYITHLRGNYGGSIEGLRIVNNIAVNGRVYSIEGSIPDSVEIDNNLVYNPGSSALRGDSLAYVEGQGNTKLLSDFQQWTGYDLHSRSTFPSFVNTSILDYRPLSTSPAIDLGKFLGESYLGSAPDAGAYEYAP